MSSLTSDNETIGGNNTINGNDYSSSSSMNLLQRRLPSSVSRSGNEHGDGNENQNQNENNRKGLAWMQQFAKDDKSRRTAKRERQKERKKNGTVNHLNVS